MAAGTMEQSAAIPRAMALPKISAATMVLLGFGWFGGQVFWAFHAGSMPLFLKGFTDSKFAISLVLSLAGVTGLIVPPVIGFLSDRTVTRLGARKPYVVAGMLGTLVCILSLPRLTALAMVIPVAGLMYVLYRVAETTYVCLLPDITPVEQRSTASGVMNLIGAIGLICCFVVSAVVWDRHPHLVFVIVALASAAFMIVAALLIHEPRLPQVHTQTPVGAMASLRNLGAEVNVLKLFIAQFCYWLAFWMASTFAVLFVVQELHVDEGRAFLVPMVFAVVAALFMFPMGMLGDRFSRKGLLSWMLACWAGLQLLVGASWTLTQVLIAFGLCAIPYAAVAVVGYAFLLDLIPSDRTAAFVGVSLLSGSLGQIVGPLIGGALIDTLGYRSIFPCGTVFILLGLLVLQTVHPHRTQPL